MIDALKSGFSARLRTLVGDRSVAEFARKCGLGDSLVRKYLDGAEPGLDKVIQIWNATSCSLEWLVTGEGDPFEGAAHRVREERATYNVTVEDFVWIPHYDVPASAGLGVDGFDEPTTKRNYFRREWWQQHIALAPQECFSMEVAGNSMYPRLSEAHTPICHRVRDGDMRGEGIYVFRLDGEVFVKSLERIPGRGIRATSENKDYTPWDIGDGSQFGEFKIIAKVIRKQLIEMP